MCIDQEESRAFLCLSANLANSGEDIFSLKLYRVKRGEINLGKNRLDEFNCVEMMIMSNGGSVIEK